MEEELSDPHEQQLLAVYKSCLTKDQKELDKTGLSLLCSKLELEESQQHALMELVKVETTVSFQKFRDGFLAFLDKTLNERVERAKNGILEELENGYTCVDYKQKHKIKLEDNGNHVDIDKDYDKKLQEILNNHGSITVEGTNSFCNKGSILPKQTVELIFEKLDLDCDGLINLTEFLLFFENANSKLQEHSISNWFSQMQRAHQIKTEGLKDFGNHQTGVVSRSYITELWELGGVTEANSLLLDLGFEGPTVNLIELSNALSSELKLHHDVSHDGGKKEYIRLLKGALILYQEEVRNINTIMEHLRCERDKLRVDITEANDRANVLAQEIDEHQTRMDEARQQQLRQLEQRHCETVKELTDLLQVEREKSNENLHAIELKLIAAQVEESKIRAELVTALEDVKALEQENRNQAEEIRRLEGVKNELARQVRELAAEHEQVANLENRESEQIVELTERMRQLQTEMKVLRDQNDELNSELESLRNREHDANSVVEVRSTSDENDVPTTEVDTEDEEGKPLKRQTRTKGKSTKESQTTNSNEKLGDIIKDLNGLLIRTNFCNECDQVRSNIISLVEQLEQYRSSQLSPGRRRKQARDLANELANTTSSTRTTSCLELSVPQQLSSTNKRISSSNDTINELKLHDNMDSSDLRAYFKTKLATLPYKSSQEWKPSTEELLREVEAKHNMERRKLTDRISELERSLEKLRQEYDQCEEYWVLKLDEERQIFEQEQKENSEKFNELLDKITEYEEQYADDSVKQSTPGRLSPIEERSILEQQYSDLEEEFQRWRRHAQMQLDSREMEIQDLKSKLKGKSSVDEEVQCPDEQMKKDYPALYSMLIKSTDEPDSSTPVPTEEDKEAKKECTQCHKLISVNSECSCQTPPQQQPSTKPQNPSANQSPRKPSSYYYHQSKSHRRDDGRSSKYLHNNHRYFSQQQPHQTQYQQNQTSQQYWNDRELRNLQRQKDRLRQEIIKLQTLRAGYPVTMDEHGIFSNLCAKLYAAEQRYKYLQMFYQVQQTEQERIRQVMWKQHMLETADLRCIIKNTENKLNQQIKLYKEQTEKLTKADFLAKELYVENAQLTETIKRLEQHCQILTQDKIDTKSPA